MPPSATYGTFILVSYNNRADVTISFRLLRHLLETTSFVYALLVFGILNPSHHAPSRSVIADMGDTNAGFRVDPKCKVSRRVTKAMHKNMISLPLIRCEDDEALTAAACVVVSIDARQLATETTSQDRCLRVKVGAGACGSSDHSAITDDNGTPHARGRG